MAQVLENNVMGVLSGAVDAVTKTLPLVTLAGWPVLANGDHCLATLVGLNQNGVEAAWEIVKVTGRVGSSLTVERGQEGIAARAWPAGTVLQMRLTAGSVATPSLVGSLLAEKVDKSGEKVLSDNNFTNAERQKLEGIAAGAQVNVPTDLALGAATANSRTITSSTGSSVTLPAASSSTAGLMTAAESTKLGTVATNASANSSDAFLLNRANHSGTQDVGTLTGVLPIAKGGTGQTSKLDIVNDLKAAQQQHLNGSVTPVYLVAGKEYSLYTAPDNPIYEGILPSSPNVGDTIVFHNGWRTWHTGRFTLSRGNTNHIINGVRESITFNTNTVCKVILTYVWGDIWQLTSEN